MANTPRSTPPTAARLAALSARYGSAADAEATRASLLAVLSRGRAVSKSPSPVPTHACPEAEACDTEGLVLEFVSIEVERGERCPLLLCRAAPTSAPAQGAAAVTGDTAAPAAADAPLRPVFVLHGTGKSLADLLRNGHLQRFARSGLLAVGVDARHHGARAQVRVRVGFRVRVRVRVSVRVRSKFGALGGC